MEVNLPFLLCFTLYLTAIFQVQAPGGLIFGGAIKWMIFVLPAWGAYIWRGLFSAFYGILHIGRMAQWFEASHFALKEVGVQVQILALLHPFSFRFFFFHRIFIPWLGSIFSHC